jgi:hypothetical protein
MILLFLTILFAQNSLNLFPSYLGIALVPLQENKPPAATQTPTPKNPASAVELPAQPVITVDTPNILRTKKPWPKPPGPRPFTPDSDELQELEDYGKALENYRKEVAEFMKEEGITVEGAESAIAQVGGSDTAASGSVIVKPSQELEAFRKALESYRVGVEGFRKTGKIKASAYPSMLGEYFEGIRSYKETIKDIQQAVGGNAP